MTFDKIGTLFIGIFIILIAGVFIGGYEFGVERGALPAWGKPEKIAVLIIDDMKKRPNNWHGDKYTITNGKICVWVANSVYGLGVRNGVWCHPEDGDLSQSSRYAILKAAKIEVIPRIHAETISGLNSAAAGK
jgi:hypothetical protein